MRALRFRRQRQIFYGPMPEPSRRARLFAEKSRTLRLFTAQRNRKPAVIAILLALVAGATLRVWFIHAFPQIQGDTLLYGNITSNWLIHGVYGVSSQDAQGVWSVSPTLIRLPGYPAFLALCFKIFGLGAYRPVLYVQAAIDLTTCMLIAAFVWRVCSGRAAMIALWLAALCPFTANYVAMPLTETLSIFCVALGFYALACWLESPHWRPAVLMTFAWSYGALLRPDGALLAVVLFFAMIVYGRRSPGLARSLRTALICSGLALIPFVAWTCRNARTFHVFQPLAPRSAVDPGDFAAPGFEAWTKTWMADFASTYEIYWNVPGSSIDIAALPSRAFDSSAQYEETRRLFAGYNRRQVLTPEIDASFAALAAERERAHPLRSRFELPLLRLVDMWLRPRVEMLNIELRWWQYSRHRSETRFAAAYGALNLALLLVAAAGAIWWPRYRAAMLGYLIVRSLVLLTVAAPEPRYTLEGFPIILAWAALAIDHWMGRIQRSNLRGERSLGVADCNRLHLQWSRMFLLRAAPRSSPCVAAGEGEASAEGVLETSRDRAAGGEVCGAWPRQLDWRAYRL